MSESETRCEKFSGNMKKWRQHDQKGTNLWIIIWEMNIHESSKVTKLTSLPVPFALTLNLVSVKWSSAVLGQVSSGSRSRQQVELNIEVNPEY